MLDDRKFDNNQAVSFPLAIILFMVLGFALAWYTVNTGEKIVENAKNSEIFNMTNIKRAESGLTQEKNQNK